ncbi:MAG: hypothetical protein ABSA17_04250 [Rhabdochlamydiaceae bacterium]|jgi:hypothetical protein
MLEDKMLSQRSNDLKFSVSKWIKHQVLLDAGEMEACLKALHPFEFYNVSTIAPQGDLIISEEKFLNSYRSYITDLKEGRVPEPDRKIFSAVMTMEREALYAKEIQPGRWMAKLAKPVIQLQHHRFFASKVDHKIHPMVMSPDSICWGLQFAFPQIFFDGSEGSYSKTTEFPNSALFAKLLKWLRAESVPTTFVWDGHKVATPIRLGKTCFAWIVNHPQLKEQGIQVHVY